MHLSLLGKISSATIATLFCASAAFADITIGYIGPVTGPVAAYGIQAKNGAQIAVDEMNKQGGVNGEKLVLKVYDDAADPKQAVSAANQVVSDGILYVVGPITSNSSMPVSNVLEENGVLMVTPGATTPELSARGMWNVIRTTGRNDQQGDAAAEYMIKHFKDKRIAVLHDKATYGQGLADAFKDALNKDGVKEVFYGSITPGEKDYGAVVSRLKAENVDYVYFGGYHPEAGLLLRQMREQGVQAPLIGGDGYSSAELWAIAGDAAEGTLFTNATDMRNLPEAQEAVKALTEAKIPVETFTINSYAAIQVIAYGIEKVGSAEDPEAVAKAIKSGEPIKTALGEITYGDRGDMTSKVYSMFKWHDGKIVPADDEEK